MRDLVRKVEAVVAESGATGVKSVMVRRGALNPVSEEHLQGHFDHAIAGTNLEGAALVVTESIDPGAPEALDLVLVSVDVTG